MAHGCELVLLSNVRVHPLNTLFMRAPKFMLLLAMGFDLRVLVVAPALLGLYGLLLHSRVDWRFGPLCYVLATPRFHRWDHARDRQCNFAGLLPMWDLMFDTFHCPETGCAQFGVDDPPVGFWKQLRLG
jgi:sterol desaturase/sphingolipid hydroxylase (fatty acid hydroxylase superfamily)